MTSFPEQTAIAFESALFLGGLGFLVWFFLSAAGRALRTRPAALPAWNVSLTDFLFLGWLVLTLGFLGQLLLRLTVGRVLHNQSEGVTMELVLYGSMFHVGALLTWLFARVVERRRRGPAMEPFRSHASLPESIRAAALTFLVVVPLVGAASFGWEYLLEILHLPTERQELVDLFTQTKSPALVGVMVVLALVVAPVSEELVFRAGIFRFLRSRIPRWVAYGVSAGVFALLHANWVSFLPLCILGVIFAMAYERTGRIAVPMLAHALFNLNTLLLVLSGIGS
ncbi:MAG: CPBP family intramembrane metalloprotease [Opitutaceae bacterium]|nr:CPBP family intramembrane metalloprotease [Opitutaceae bacterium]